jgi:hypothetical protein
MTTLEHVMAALFLPAMFGWILSYLLVSSDRSYFREQTKERGDRIGEEIRTRNGILVKLDNQSKVAKATFRELERRGLGYTIQFDSGFCNFDFYQNWDDSVRPEAPEPKKSAKHKQES